MNLHLRIDDEPENSKRRFACGIGPALPEGDCYLHASEQHNAAAYFATHDAEACPGCFPAGTPEFGVPISRLSGRPGHPGFEEFRRIGASWGYD